jgi:CTP synthase (UTP-ammonia lyase)
VTLRIAVVGDDDAPVEAMATTVDAVLDAAVDIDLVADARLITADELDDDLVSRLHAVVLATADVPAHQALVDRCRDAGLPTLVTAVPDEEPPDMAEVLLVDGSFARDVYATTRVIEAHPAGRALTVDVAESLLAAGATVGARSPGDEPCLVERADHPYFVVTAYAPQLSSNPGRPHVLFKALLQTANAQAT